MGTYRRKKTPAKKVGVFQCPRNTRVFGSLRLKSLKLTLENYLLDGRCEISNNRTERCTKSYGTRRKNFLFHNSVNGARSSAIIYSLVETAKANHLNVFQYLYTLLLYMPDYKDKPAGVEVMMPWSEFIKERCSEVMNTETETPEYRGRYQPYNALYFGDEFFITMEMTVSYSSLTNLS